MGRAPELDLLRFVAVSLVLIHHIPAEWIDSFPKFAASPLSVVAHIGWVGVDLFFVLSGFLVSGLLFAEYEKRQAVSPFWFLIRRGFKIYPAFWALLAATILFGRYIDFKFRWHGVLWELLFLQNYGLPIFGHTWSLAVEEHFYILLSFLIAGLAAAGGPNPFRRLPQIIAIVCALVLVGRCVGAWFYPAAVMHERLYQFTHHRLDGLALGVALAYWRWSSPASFAVAAGKLRLPSLLLTGLVLGLVGATDIASNRWMNSLGLTVIPLAFGVLLTASPSLWAWLEPRCGIVLRWCAWVGRYSYSIYLWHIIVRDAGKFTLIHSPMSASATTILYLAASLGVGIGMASLIEMPVLRLRDRFFPSRSS